MNNPLTPNEQINLPHDSKLDLFPHDLSDAFAVSAAVDGPFGNQEKEDHEPVSATVPDLQDLDQQTRDELEKPHTPHEKAEQANFLSHNDGGS